MWLVIILLAVAVILLLFGPRLLTGLREYRKYRGTRIVTCPETDQPAAVEVDALLAGSTELLGQHALRLQECSRWPERQGCGQECLQQIEASPQACLLKHMLADWYSGKDCVFCHLTFDRLDLHHRPAFLSPAGELVEWHQLEPEQMPAVMGTHQPVCWHCYIAESFRRAHPDLVTERPWRRVG